MTKRKRKIVYTTTLTNPQGEWFWFKGQGPFPPSPQTKVYGPFASEADADESVRQTLLGGMPVVEGGMINSIDDLDNLH